MRRTVEHDFIASGTRALALSAVDAPSEHDAGMRHLAWDKKASLAGAH